MISCKILGAYGRFGNQLFQYAFLRTTALRLGVPFYCPPWLGDTVFQLDDDDERCSERRPLEKLYREPVGNCGFNASALNIEDGTEIAGYFQSERYFDRDQIRQWYTFREDVAVDTRRKYAGMDLAGSTGVHLRFSDMMDHGRYALPTQDYYHRALKKVRPGPLVIFSDDIVRARYYLEGVDGRKCHYIEGNRNFEDLYLMTLCGDFISSISTFSWWGAWLGHSEERVVVCPKSWLRPGQSIQNKDIACRGWLVLSSCCLLRDHYLFFQTEKLWRKRWNKARQRSLYANLKSVGNYLRNRIRLAVRGKPAPQVGKIDEREDRKLHFGKRLRRKDVHTIPNGNGELRLFMATRNSALRLPYLFTYYRTQGVDRFFVVDNGSTDGTAEFLASQPDVHVFRTEDSYSQTESGILWVEYLMDLYGRDRWCVVVDDDEIFFYPHVEELLLKDFCEYLDVQGSTAVHSFLLDMYSDKPVDKTFYRQGEPFLDACPFFEMNHRQRRSDGYMREGCA